MELQCKSTYITVYILYHSKQIMIDSYLFFEMLRRSKIEFCTLAKIINMSALCWDTPFYCTFVIFMMTQVTH